MPAQETQEERMIPLLTGTEGTHPRDRVLPLPAERQQLQLRELLQNHLQAGMLPLLQQGGQEQLQPVNQLQIVLQPIAQSLHAEQQQLQLRVQLPLAVSRLLSPEGALQDQ